MAVLNTTPDSFSDGGVHSSCDAAIAHGKRCIHEGAGIVDVGGESTRPGAARVDIAEQIARTQPVIAALATLSPVSIDTTRAEVARAALAAGACIVNDVSAALDDPEIVDASTGISRLRPLEYRT
jgi:dihydropteroate synthase